MECYSTRIPECTERAALVNPAQRCFIFLFIWRNPIERGLSHSGPLQTQDLGEQQSFCTEESRTDNHPLYHKAWQSYQGCQPLQSVSEADFWQSISLMFLSMMYIPAKNKDKGFGGGASSCTYQLIILLYSPCVTLQLVSSLWLIVLLANWK